MRILRFQGTQGSDHQLVRKCRAGAEHLGASDDDAFAVLIDDGDSDAGVGAFGRGFGTVALRIDDNVGDVEIVIAGVFVVVADGIRATAGVGRADVLAHEHGAERRGHMVWGTAHEPVTQFCPGNESLAPLDEFGVAGWELPRAIDASAGAGDFKRHALDIFGSGLEVIERGNRARGVAKGGMGGHAINLHTIDQDAPAIVEAAEVVRSGFRHAAVIFLTAARRGLRR